MPNEFVDLGYLFWSRVFQNGGTAVDLAVYDAYILDIRNRIRTVMEAENGGDNWEVSRVIRWQGSPTTTYGYGFKIRRLVSGVPDGREWLILMAGPYTSFADTIAEPEEALQDGGPIFNHFVFNGGNDFDDGFYTLHYHSNGATETYAFEAGSDENAYNGTTPDLDPPAVSPKTNLDGFMVTPGNGGAPRGNITASFAETTPTRWLFVWNHEKPFCGIYHAGAYHTLATIYNIAGDIIIPRVATDVYPEGVYQLTVTYGGLSNTYNTRRVLGLTPDGTTPQIYDVLEHNRLTYYNQPRADNTYDVDSFKLSNTLYDKGYTDNEIFGQVGWNATSRYQLYESPLGGWLQIGNSEAWPWKLANPIPFAGWPLNPQLVGMGL